MISPALFFLKTMLATWSLLCFHTNFRIICSSSVKNSIILIECVTYDLYYIEVCSLYTDFVESFYHKWKSNALSMSIVMIQRRQWHPTPVLLPGKPHGWRSLVQSMGSLRVGPNWATSLSLFTFMHWRRKWQPTPVFLPGESQGRGSLVGCSLWGHTELDMTEVT